MIWNRERGDVSILNEDDVASPLRAIFQPSASKILTTSRPLSAGRIAIQIVTSICRVSMVSGKPRSAWTSRHSAIASRMLASASSRVEPWLTQPGIAGHSEIQIPSSSRSSVAMNFIIGNLAREHRKAIQSSSSDTSGSSRIKRCRRSRRETCGGPAARNGSRRSAGAAQYQDPGAGDCARLVRRQSRRRATQRFPAPAGARTKPPHIEIDGRPRAC
jgi:hypothetical protein